jgi:simple sugar transport system ATP-binding protein
VNMTRSEAMTEQLNRPPAETVLEMRGVTKSYHGAIAVNEVDFTLRRGEVHALLGENGAGKSTLTKMMSGVTAPTSGEVLLDGAPYSAETPAEAREHGVVMVFQETSLVNSMTVAQNLYLGDEKAFNRLRPLYISAQVFLSSLNFEVDPWALAGTLGAAKKQMVEIARAVHHEARIIIFDEPTTALTPEEKEHFFALVRRLKAKGVSIIFISHALEEALEIADRITILRDGSHVITDDTHAFDRESIVRHMVGRDLSAQIYSGGTRTPRPRGPLRLSVENLSMGKAVRNNSFSVFAGQVTGLFGLIGSGRTETAKIVSGVLKRNTFHGGTVRLDGKAVRYRVPRQAMKDGVLYVTEDRKVEGFFETMSIRDNLVMGRLAQRGGPLVLNSAEARALYDDWKKRLNIKALSDESKVVELSGGNQQKVVIAKSLVQEPRLIIFDEPTRGVDVGAIAEIHEMINGLAEAGLAVVVISSYLPEVRSLSDRILVMRTGRVVAEFDPDASEDEIMFASVH